MLVTITNAWPVAPPGHITPTSRIAPASVSLSLCAVLPESSIITPSTCLLSLPLACLLPFSFPLIQVPHSVQNDLEKTQTVEYSPLLINPPMSSRFTWNKIPNPSQASRALPTSPTSSPTVLQLLGFLDSPNSAHLRGLPTGGPPAWMLSQFLAESTSPLKGLPALDPR